LTKPEYSYFRGYFGFPYSQTYSGMTEQELTDGLITQNKEAIQYLVNNYQKNVIKTAYYFVSNMEDAEDVSQEVFLEVLKSICHFKKTSSLSTWIYRITVNKSLDLLRKQRRRNMLNQMTTLLTFSNESSKRSLTDPSHMDTRNDDREKRKILDLAVNSLPENQKIAFLLNKYDELSYKEIAEIMNLSLASVESLIHRAKINLQKKLVTHFSEYAGKNK
jgi:RNA polymerase sigma-70 factor, ECF subfamily